MTKPATPEDIISVPRSALAWLFGEGPDANGQHFGDEIPARAPPYWWRRHFAKLIGADGVTSAALAAAPPAYPLVEPVKLIWEHHPQAHSEVRAASPIGRYRITNAGLGVRWTGEALGRNVWRDAATIDEAKAAAQGDFAARVTSCLAASTGPAPLDDRVAALWKAAEAVEEWWLREGMQAFNGAPYAIFAIRAALSARPTSPTETVGDRDRLPSNHFVLEQADLTDGTGRVAQTVSIGKEGSSGAVEYQRIVHADEAYAALSEAKP